MPRDGLAGAVEAALGYGTDARRRDIDVADEEISGANWRGRESPFARIAGEVEYLRPEAVAGDSMRLRLYADHVMFDRLVHSNRSVVDVDAGRRVDWSGRPLTLRMGLAYKARMRGLKFRKGTASIYAGIDGQGSARLRLGGSYAFGLNEGAASDIRSTQHDLRLEAEYRADSTQRLKLRLRCLDETAALDENSRRLYGVALDWRHYLHRSGDNSPVWIVVGASGSRTLFAEPAPGTNWARLDTATGMHVTLGRVIGNAWSAEVDASFRRRDSNESTLDRRAGHLQLSARRIF